MRTKISSMLAHKLRRAVAHETSYQQAKTNALAQLSAAFRLGGRKTPEREALHDPQNLR
jgi:hypothetical protein